MNHAGVMGAEIWVKIDGPSAVSALPGQSHGPTTKEGLNAGSIHQGRTRDKTIVQVLTDAGKRKSTPTPTGHHNTCASPRNPRAHRDRNSPKTTRKARQCHS